jgi:competence protein CoiA
MKFANVAGERVAAFPEAGGTCCFCNARMIAKCGDKLAWHWAHMPRPKCDPWWENETDWHRAWKNHFPQEWQEVVQVDAETGERHIADVKTRCGVVIEFQNSPMTKRELDSREQFYKSVLWVVNASNFGFVVGERMPDPSSDFGRDCEFFNPTAFRKKSDNSTEIHLRGVFSTVETEDAINKNYVGHHAYEWNRAREVWLAAHRPVYFDVGGDDLWLLVGEFAGYFDKRKTTRLGTVQKIVKAAFIQYHGGTYSVRS